jgi:hypothetical protein
MAIMAEEGFWARRWNHVAREWRVILEAKGVFGSAALLLVFGTAVVVWRGMAALDNAEIEGLYATIKEDEATIRFQDIRLKDALSSGARAPTTPAEVDVDFSNLRPLSNDALRNAVSRLAASLREFEATYENATESVIMTPLKPSQDKQEMQKEWDDQMKQQQELEEKKNYEWQTLYRGRVLAIYDELCRRLGIIPVNSQSLGFPSKDVNNSEATAALSTGMLAGYYPVSALADYLESLARQL